MAATIGSRHTSPADSPSKLLAVDWGRGEADGSDAADESNVADESG